MKPEQAMAKIDAILDQYIAGDLTPTLTVIRVARIVGLYNLRREEAA